ncbi:MAG: phosphoesterase [Gammaproteobacteria bacterium]|nr:phosphoesterase [Gammaproteobacteria bacterium]
MNILPASMRAFAATLVVCLGAVTQASGRELRAGAQPPVRHVFLIVLENKSFRNTFGTGSAAPYLATTLLAHGALLENYFAVGHFSLDNYIALVSGQAPNPATQRDCHQVTEFQPSRPGLDPHGELPGSGCVYPSIVKTLPDQLGRARLTWKGYMEDLGLDRGRDEDSACTTRRIGRMDPTERATGADEYASKHDPFVYFHTIIDDQAQCAAHVVGLDELAKDLRSTATTPNYSFITPNLCHDGHDPLCDDGAPGGLKGINGFLKKWVPLITHSEAFRKDGLLVITFDESDGAPPRGSDACCGEKPLPGGPLPGVRGPGGGRVGAVVLSPFIRPGTVSTVPYNHYALLRTIEDIFGLRHLGYAAEPGLRPFGADVFTRH